MAHKVSKPSTAQLEDLEQIKISVQSIKQECKRLSASVEAIERRVDSMTSLEQALDVTQNPQDKLKPSSPLGTLAAGRDMLASTPTPIYSHSSGSGSGQGGNGERKTSTAGHPSIALGSKIILSTYPGQSGIDPMPLNWGHKDPMLRGPVVVSRARGTIGRRNAIGAHGGSYSIYHALAVASRNLDVEHKPDFTNTEPAVNLGPFSQWAESGRIVSMDPLGHLSPWLFADLVHKEYLDIRPTIAITKAHMKLPELEQSVRAGRLSPDGKICLNEAGELAVTKFAVEPVWYLPGVAERFGIGM